MCFIQFSMAHWKKRGIFMVENQVFGRAGGELILIALGMTATILAYDLAKAGLWAIDIGHIDVEYEWFIRGATEKVALNGKFVNEAPGGRDVAEVKDSLYESQIIESIY